MFAYMKAVSIIYCKGLGCSPKLLVISSWKQEVHTVPVSFKSDSVVCVYTFRQCRFSLGPISKLSRTVWNFRTVIGLPFLFSSKSVCSVPFYFCSFANWNSADVFVVVGACLLCVQWAEREFNGIFHVVLVFLDLPTLSATPKDSVY
jgi:hypothetical protein